MLICGVDEAGKGLHPCRRLKRENVAAPFGAVMATNIPVDIVDIDIRLAAIGHDLVPNDTGVAIGEVARAAVDVVGEIGDGRGI